MVAQLNEYKFIALYGKDLLTVLKDLLIYEASPGMFYSVPHVHEDTEMIVVYKDAGKTIDYIRILQLSAQKHDSKKPLWNLLPFLQLSKIVDVLTHGASKYAPNQWKSLPDSKERYFAATLRHLVAWRGGEVLDPDSGLPHLAHAGCNILFLMWFDDNKES